MDPHLGRRHPHLPQRVDSHLQVAAALRLAVQPQRLDDLVADPERRIERRLRILQDHRDFAPAYLSHLPVVEAGQLAPP
jgi:hypothetical protein